MMMNNPYENNIPVYYSGYDMFPDKPNMQMAPTQMEPFVQVPENQVKASRPNIRKFMHDFNDETRPKFNPNWFERRDDDIIEGIEKVINSCQRDKYFTLRVLSFRVVKDYGDILVLLQEKFSHHTKNGKKQDNPYDYINLRDSDVILLIVNYYIKINCPPDQIRIDPKTGEPEQTEGELQVYILLPRYVEKYYFRLQGNFYAPSFQIVDGSTYNNGTSASKTQTVTLKTTFMPIKLYREFYKIKDVTTKDAVTCACYASYIFSKKVDVIKYILGRYGYYGAIQFMGYEDSNIHMSKEVIDNPNYYNFKCRDKITVVSIPKIIFDQDLVAQAFVYTLMKGVHKYDRWADIYDPRYWCSSLGGDFLYPTLEKGIAVLDSIESIYDIETKDSIKLPKEEKESVYTVLRWMCREFGNLRQKDNLDISTKKARMADEYLPALYAMKLSKAIYRISDKGKNVKYTDVVRAIDIPVNYILTSINSSKLANYVDLVNDNDAETALSYTYKGISGLGDQTGSSSAVPLIYRTIHPSHMGRVDPDASSASDPGMSGVIAPMSEDHDRFFTDYQEPNEWRKKFAETMTLYRSSLHIKDAIEMKKKFGLEYDYVKDDMVTETISTYKRLVCPLIDLNGIIDYSVNTTMDYVLPGNKDKPKQNPESGDIVVKNESVEPKNENDFVQEE